MRLRSSRGQDDAPTAPVAASFPPLTSNLSPEILFLVASFSSKPTLAVLARTSKGLTEGFRRLFYKDVVLKDPSQYLPFFSAFTYFPQRGPITDVHDLPDPKEKILPGENDKARQDKRTRAYGRAGKGQPPTRFPSLSDHLGTLTLLVPPPEDFDALLLQIHPHLSRKGYEPNLAYHSSFLPITFSNLIIHSRERYVGCFFSTTKLLNPTNLTVVSLDPKARTWTLDGRYDTLIHPSWIALETIIMENVFVLRDRREVSGSVLGLATPFRRCPRLRSVRIVVTKEDQPEVDGNYEGEVERKVILGELLYNVPAQEYGDFEKLERFEVALTGRERVEGLRRWMDEIREMMMEEWTDPERWERWFRLELLEGQVETRELEEQDSEGRSEGEVEE